MGGFAIYNNFAFVYDKLMYDVDYKKWVDYIQELFEKYGVNPTLVLDLGCGTGNITVEMAQKGYDMTGVDLSPDMLACAMEKSRGKGLDILYLNQDITEFELYGTVDVILCLMDTVNYITDKRQLRKLFKLVKNYLNPGGLFIFDINTPYKLEEILGDNVFYEIHNDLVYIWNNEYDNKRKICRFDLTFFTQEGSKYDRFDEIHYERSYSLDELKYELTEKAGLTFLDVYDHLSFNKPKNKSERVFFVCRK